MSEGMLHICDVEGPKKMGSMETRLEEMEQQVFKCQGMVERGLNANHMMITEFTNKHKMDANDIGKHLSRLYDRVDQLQGQIYDLQNQNYKDKVLAEVKERSEAAEKKLLDVGKLEEEIMKLKKERLEWGKKLDQMAKRGNAMETFLKDFLTKILATLTGMLPSPSESYRTLSNEL
ncbi:40s ribosomal protein s5-1 [Hordeum vulgare]|nr:40s ribosomal protein s5-1 [Hordeum vulgare]